jgi:hypothetical protein
LVKRVLLACGSTPHARVWRNDTGLAYTIDRTPFRYGTPGAPDILGILCTGHLIGFEVKTGKAVQNQDQIRFQCMILTFKGFYFVVRSEFEARALLNQTLRRLGVPL